MFATFWVRYIRLSSLNIVEQEKLHLDIQLPCVCR